jgi:hypothetical protein
VNDFDFAGVPLCCFYPHHCHCFRYCFDGGGDDDKYDERKVATNEKHDATINLPRTFVLVSKASSQDVGKKKIMSTGSQGKLVKYNNQLTERAA